MASTKLRPLAAAFGALRDSWDEKTLAVSDLSERERY
jgi:hypothetical protein